MCYSTKCIRPKDMFESTKWFSTKCNATMRYMYIETVIEIVDWTNNASLTVLTNFKKLKFINLNNLL